MIKRILTLSLVLGLLAGAMTLPAEAKKKKKKKAAPVATTLFMEGTSKFGEEDQLANDTYLQLVPAAGSGEKSAGLPSYAVGPNNKCAGNALFPVFIGGVVGNVTGDVKVTFEAASTPGGKVEVRIWPDLNDQACNDDYVEPAASVVVDLPTGRGLVEAVIPDVNFTAVNNIMIQLTAVAGSIGGGPSVPPFYGRAYYGTDKSKVEFSCIPAAGSASCLAS